MKNIASFYFAPPSDGFNEECEVWIYIHLREARDLTVQSFYLLEYP